MPPKIYELPAGATSEDNFSSTERIRNIASSSGVSQSAGWTATKPMQASLKMLDDQMRVGRRNITQWFDTQAAILSEQQLDPDKHRAAYGRLQQLVATKHAEVRAKADAQAHQIKSMRELVEAGTFTPEQMEQTMFVMAGVPAGHVRTTYAQRKPQKPMARLRDLKYQAERIESFRGRFVDHRKDIFGKGLWRARPGTEKKTDIRATDEELQAYIDAEDQLYNIQMEMTELFEALSPLEKTAHAGVQAVERFGKRREPRRERSVFGLNKFGGFQVTPASAFETEKPKRLTKETATAILKEANGDKAKAEQIARSRGYKIEGYKL